MSDDNEDAYGFNQAFEAAKAEGRKEGEREGYERGRKDAASIMSHEEAVGRIEVAAELAGDPDISFERGVSLLGKMPKGSRSNFAEMMQGRSPNVGANQETSLISDDREARVQQLRSAGTAASKARR